MNESEPSSEVLNPGDALHCIVRQFCRYCEKPEANQHEWDTMQGGEGTHLCWGECGVSADEALDVARGNLAALHRWQDASEREIKDLRAKYTDLISVSQSLYCHLWKNVGDSADWPLEIKAETEEDANELKELLETLRLLLSNSDYATSVSISKSTNS